MVKNALKVDSGLRASKPNTKRAGGHLSGLGVMGYGSHGSPKLKQNMSPCISTIGINYSF